MAFEKWKNVLEKRMLENDKWLKNNAGEIRVEPDPLHKDSILFNVTWNDEQRDRFYLNNYPFSARVPVPSFHGPLFMYNGLQTQMIPKLLQKIHTSKRVLVACHFRPYALEDSPHWLKKSIDSIVGDPNASYETVDISPQTNGKAWTLDEGIVWQGDVFSDEFIDTFSGKFEFLFLPDCDGAWYEYQKGAKADLKEAAERMAELCLRTFNLLRNNGTLLVGKLMTEGLQEEVQGILNAKGYTTELRTPVLAEDDLGITWLSIQKTRVGLHIT